MYQYFVAVLIFQLLEVAIEVLAKPALQIGDARVGFNRPECGMVPCVVGDERWLGGIAKWLGENMFNARCLGRGDNFFRAGFVHHEEGGVLVRRYMLSEWFEEIGDRIFKHGYQALWNAVVAGNFVGPVEQFLPVVVHED